MSYQPYGILLRELQRALVFYWLFWVLIRWKKLNPTQVYLGRLIIFSAFIEIVAKVLALTHTNNLPLLHLYTLVEFILLYELFSLHLPALRESLIRYVVLIGFYNYCAIECNHMEDGPKLQRCS